MSEQRVACNTSRPLSDTARRTALAALANIDYRQTSGDPQIPGPPIVMAPIQVRKELVGMVVVPPMARRSAIVRDVGRILSLRGTGILIVITAVATMLIFGPARRRLRALEEATERLGGA